MPKVRFAHALFLAGAASAMAGVAAFSGSALAQAVQDPGLRGGPPGAGGPLPNLIPAGDHGHGFFKAATNFFTSG